MIQETSRQPRISPLAGQPAPKEMLIDISRVEREYHARKPDMDDPNQRVAFGTSGHRGIVHHAIHNPPEDARFHIRRTMATICRRRLTDG